MPLSRQPSSSAKHAYRGYLADTGQEFFNTREPDKDREPYEFDTGVGVLPEAIDMSGTACILQRLCLLGTQCHKRAMVPPSFQQLCHPLLACECLKQQSKAQPYRQVVCGATLLQ